MLQSYGEEENILYIAVVYEEVSSVFVLFLVEDVTVLYTYWIALTRSRWTQQSSTFTGNENVGKENCRGLQ